MHELLEALLSVGIYVLLLGLLGWALYYAFGPQVFGVPAMAAVLVVLAGVSIISNVGLAGLAVLVVGLGVLVMVIGMAMAGGARRGRTADEDEPVDRP